MYSQTNAVPFSQVYGCSIFGSSISLRCQAWDHIVVVTTATVHWWIMHMVYISTILEADGCLFLRLFFLSTFGC
jgi:hypothetical protein